MNDAEESGDLRKVPSPKPTNYQPVSESDREMATTALQEFEEGKYEDCLITLQKLQSERPQDLKVQYNKCVVEYYLSNFKDTEIFKGKSFYICSLAIMKMKGMEAPENVNLGCVLIYNQAVVLFHLHQFNLGIKTLQRMLEYIELLDETIGKRICFLLCDLYLRVYQPRRLSSLLTYMEVAYFSSKNSSNANSKEDQKEDCLENNALEASKRRFQLIKARLFATLKTAEACKREIKNLMSAGSDVQNIPVFYLKSQLEYQRGNYRKAVKLLNSATTPKDLVEYFRETGDSLSVIYYNNVGCIHFYMGKPHLGKFYTKKALEEFEDLMCKTSNQGHDPRNVLDSRPLHLFSASTRHQLLYNIGLQCMQLRNFEDAFKCFMEVIRSYYGNPRLWLRIAECCMHIHEPNGVEQLVECTEKTIITYGHGTGPYKKVIWNPSPPNKVEEFKFTGTKEITPSLHYAMICLKNARALLPEYHADPAPGCHNIESSSQEDSVYVSDEDHHLSVLPSMSITGPEITSLRHSILIACSYVSLCLGDVRLALKSAAQLLSEPRLSDAHKFLAHSYAGEALLFMDSIAEAVEHFTVLQDNDVELAFPASSSEASLKHLIRFDNKNDDDIRSVGNIPNWMPDRISSAKFVSQYNLAVAYAVREEWTKASQCLETLTPNGVIKPLVIYVQLHSGMADYTT